MSNESLKNLLKEIEQKTGSFSTYETTAGPGQDISFDLKPAQQFLSELKVVANINAPLSQLKEGVLNNSITQSAIVRSFDNQNSSKLELTAARINRLLKSAKTYVNTDIMPEGLFASTIAETESDKKIIPQDGRRSEQAKLHWQNMAVGICHTQEIDLLTDQTIQNGRALNAPRSGVIEVDAPALLLLSSPALNFDYGTANELTGTQPQEFIAGMYRNLFQATLTEGRKYITMPAAGLGAFGGNPDLYFATLMTVATEFPDLNIIYHPAQFWENFDQQLNIHKPDNVVKATKDVLFIANELTQKGYPCSFHNPSDSDVVYGVYDVGEYWKDGTGARYVGEEHIGAMTTAPLNSYGLNPQAYTTVIEKSFAIKNTVLDKVEIPQSQLNDNVIDFFDYEARNIDYSDERGTHVSLQTNDSFNNWFAKLPEKQSIALNSGYELYKIDNNKLAMNRGFNSPGIQIIKTNDKFTACNNVAGDNTSKENEALEVQSPIRQRNLTMTLAILKQTLMPSLNVDVSKEENNQKKNDNSQNQPTDKISIIESKEIMQELPNESVLGQNDQNNFDDSQNQLPDNLNINVTEKKEQEAKVPSDLGILAKKISDHEPLFVDTPQGKMCYFNIMCHGAATQHGYNNHFKFTETPDEYQSRLDKIVQVMVKLQQEHQVVGFMLQEAPRINDSDPIEKKVARHFYEELSNKLLHFKVDAQDFSRLTANTRSSTFSTFDKHIFPTQKPIRYSNPGRYQEILLADKKGNEVTAVNIHGDYGTQDTTAQLVIDYSQRGSIVGGDLNIVERSDSYNKMIEALVTIPDATIHIVKAKLFSTVDCAISTVNLQKNYINTNHNSTQVTSTIKREEKSEPPEINSKPVNKVQLTEKSPLISKKIEQRASVTNNYQHIVENPTQGRYHFFEVEGNATKFQLEGMYASMKGDYLKSMILMSFKIGIENAKDQNDLNNLLNNHTKFINVLEETQGLFSSLFGIQTSSKDALDAMIEERTQQISGIKPK